MFRIQSFLGLFQWPARTLQDKLIQIQLPKGLLYLRTKKRKEWVQISWPYLPTWSGCSRMCLTSKERASGSGIPSKRSHYPNKDRPQMGKLLTGSHFHQVGNKSSLYYLLLCCFNRLLKTAQRSADGSTKSLSFSPHIIFASWIFFSFLSSWVKFYWSSLEDGGRIGNIVYVGETKPCNAQIPNCEL